MQKFLILFFSSSLFSLPTNPIIHQGTVEIRYENKLAEIDSGAFAELHWGEFSIGPEETVRFLQPDTRAIAVNRVLSFNPSTLFGKLEAIGQIVLINPNGILIGKEAQIDTGSLIASTLDLMDSSYKSTKEFCFSTSRNAPIIHEGIITSRSGPVILLGENIKNLGSIFSSMGVLFGSGKNVQLKIDELPKISMGDVSNGQIENLGTIESEYCHFLAHTESEVGIKNSGSITTLGENGKITLEAPLSTIANYGTLRATNDLGVGGEIRLLGRANHLHEGALIDASGAFGGGTILIGGDYKGLNPEIPNSKEIWTAPGATILANALEMGDGGKIIFWGDDSNYFRGRVEAMGGPSGGDGGFIEISSKGYLDPIGEISAKAFNGKGGTLLFNTLFYH